MMVNGRYSSFKEVASLFGIEPVVKVTKDKEKLKSQQEKFQAKHLCKACKQPLKWIEGTSIMTCDNPSCKGIKISKKDKDGNDVSSYITSYDLLDETGAEIAGNIFTAEA